MPSTRSKLVLDEESFQGLLAAAFTIQQYNDKQGGIGAVLSAELTGTVGTNGTGGKNGTGGNEAQDKATAANEASPPATSLELCRECGAPLLAAGIPCPACDAEVFRPGERLQRTWATMWSLSQEQGAFPGPGPRPEQIGAEPPLAATNLDRATQRVAPEDLVIASEVAQEGGESDAALAFPHNIDINAVATAVGPRVKLRFHRADLYLGLSVLIALVALLWPAASAGRAELTPWERMLVTIGIAEEPSQAEVHYSGDPNIKVWVDTQAALYYCPGDDLYGKSPGGHYTTQHDAQLDRFEPALRRACVP